MRAFSREAADRHPLGLVRDDGLALPAGARSASSRSRCGSCRPSSSTRGSGRCRGTPGGGSPTTTRATCSASCASRPQPRRLLGGSGAELVPFARPDLCCGFGGTFSVRQPEVSLAMADDKLGRREAAATIVTADPGCLMHLRGRAEKVGAPARVVHLATALAQGRRVAELAQPRGRGSARSRAASSATRTSRTALDEATDRLRTNRRRAWAGAARRRGAPASARTRSGWR